MLIVFFIFQVCAFHQGVSFSLRLLPPGSPVRGMSPWVVLPIKGERSGLTRLSFPAPRLSFLLYSSGEPSIVILIFWCDRCDLRVGDKHLGSRSPVCHLVRPCRGRPMCAPFGPRVVLQGCGLEASYFPLPLVRPCRARLPWRVRLWSVRPWLASPGGSGVPSVLFLPLFPAVFGVSVLSPS